MNLKQTLNRFRAWRLNRWADQLLEEAFQLRRNAKYGEAQEFRSEARRVLDLARRIDGARS